MGQMYLVCLYFVCTVFTTVGFGEFQVIVIAPHNILNAYPLQFWQMEIEVLSFHKSKSISIFAIPQETYLLQTRVNGYQALDYSSVAVLNNHITILFFVFHFIFLKRFVLSKQFLAF